MATSGTVSGTNKSAGNGRVLASIAWTAATNGVVNGGSVTLPPGRVSQTEFIPGTPTPSNNYSAGLLDQFGADLLQGGGSGLSSAAASFAMPANGGVYFSGGAVTPVISGAGSGVSGGGPQGTLDVYLAP